MVKVEVGGETYYVNKKLKEKWDNIKDGNLVKKDEDRIYVIDGREGTGKSVFALQQAAYIDPSIIEEKKLPRITYSAEETLKAIRNTKSKGNETKAIIWDEAFRGLSSKSALSRTNKKLVQSLMEMRQNNLVLFIVSPSFFLLEHYPAVLRTNALFHIEKEKTDGMSKGKRFFRVYNYNKKAQLYMIGVKKGWGYPIRTKFKDYFFNKYPGGKEFEKLYRQKKLDSLKENIQEENKESIGWKEMQRNVLLKYIYDNMNLTYTNIQEIMEKAGYPIARGTLSKVLSRKKPIIVKSSE